MTDDQISEALRATREIVADLDQRARDAENVLTEIRGDLRQVTQTSERLANLIWTGNGTDSLLTRMALLEGTVGRLEAGLAEETEERERQEQMAVAARLRDKAERSKIKAAWITSLVAAAAAVACALIALLK